MARIMLEINKSLEQNASLYYDKAKKIKKKKQEYALNAVRSLLRLESIGDATATNTA